MLLWDGMAQVDLVAWTERTDHTGYLVGEAMGQCVFLGAILSIVIPAASMPMDNNRR